MRVWCWFLLLAACEHPSGRDLDRDLVRITGEGKLRTDTIGDGPATAPVTFVLVDAENTSHDGAYVMLVGTLADAAGLPVGEFSAQSLWIPAGEIRTFALVDRDHKARPTASAARIVVRGATIPEQAPLAQVDQIREIEDDGKLVVQGVLHNAAPRRAEIVVIASFHAPDGRPMTRPFSVLQVAAGKDQAVQFVSPPGAKHGTIFVGDLRY